jgi:hypothetical protein
MTKIQNKFTKKFLKVVNENGSFIWDNEGTKFATVAEANKQLQSFTNPKRVLQLV